MVRSDNLAFTLPRVQFSTVPPFGPEDPLDGGANCESLLGLVSSAPNAALPRRLDDQYTSLSFYLQPSIEPFSS
jgi:hypothetical protein